MQKEIFNFMSDFSSKQIRKLTNLATKLGLDAVSTEDEFIIDVPMATHGVGVNNMHILYIFKIDEVSSAIGKLSLEKTIVADRMLEKEKMKTEIFGLVSIGEAKKILVSLAHTM